jgi:hypothetical protein
MQVRLKKEKRRSGIIFKSSRAIFACRRAGSHDEAMNWRHHFGNFG